MEDYERSACIYGGQMAAEYTKEIGKTDLAALTPAEFVTFCEVMCLNYHGKRAELENKILFESQIS